MPTYIYYLQFYLVHVLVEERFQEVRYERQANIAHTLTARAQANIRFNST